jgi:hypothetical protein
VLVCDERGCARDFVQKKKIVNSGLLSVRPMTPVTGLVPFLVTKVSNRL